jgi:glycosyltransferase involved in cell wall biosynthesis
MSDRVRTLLRPLARAARGSIAAADGLASYAAGLAPGTEPRVSYGFDIPARSTEAHGGIVKLQSLAARFPHAGRRFNILYLVSSRLPDGAAWLARVARAKGARVVLNQNGVAYQGWYGDGWEQVNAPLAAVLPLADHVLYQSEFCRTAADRFLGPAPAASEVLYNPVDTDRFTPAASGTSGATLLLAGTQHAVYRVFTALRVVAALAAIMPAVRLLVTGRLRWADSSTAAAQVAALAGELGIGDRVEMLGPYTQDQAPEIFRRAGILLHTKYKDPCPTVVLEAMASGLPVVYSHTGGVPELVGEEGGIGVPGADRWDRDEPPDPAALAAAVQAIAGRREQFAEAARRRAVERFDVRRWIARHETVFASICRPRTI